MSELRRWGPLLLPALLAATLTACAARQERIYPDSAEIGLVLLARQGNTPLEPELTRLFDTTLAELERLPVAVRGWLRPVAPALQRLKSSSLALASRDPAAFQRALTPYRPLAAYPIALEQLKTPADVELAPLVQDANRLLVSAWRAHGALWLAERLEPPLSTGMAFSPGDMPHQLGLGVGAVSQLHLLLQASGESLTSATERDGHLLESLRQAQLRREVLRARLAAGSEQPRVVQDDLELLVALEQSLLRARVRLADTQTRLQSRLIQAGDRIEALAKMLG